MSKTDMDSSSTPAPRLLVTIDGPAGAGKTTVSRLLAESLRYRYLDTGALYRSVAYGIRKSHVDFEDPKALSFHLKSFFLTPKPDQNGFRIFWSGRDITDEIRTPEISMLASTVSAKPLVREFLLDLQRQMGKEKAMVCEGRDMGTVVFPDADIKFYLDADPRVRACRRFREMAPQTDLTLEDIERDIRKRDRNDSQRAISPLKPAADAIRIDCSRIPPESVVAKMLNCMAPLLKPCGRS